MTKLNLRSRSAGECEKERKLTMIMSLRCEIELQMSTMLKFKYYEHIAMSRKFKNLYIESIKETPSPVISPPFLTIAQLF